MNEDAMSCPGCAGKMCRQSFPRKLGGELQIDLCFACKLIWFDKHESLQLAPSGLINLFKLIHTHQKDGGHPFSEPLNCPRCRTPLSLTHDLQRTTRFVYYRCWSGHGRLIAFYQFLREKNFVRTLTSAEVSRIKADIKQVHCSNCGAPIDLGRDSVCSFCKTPISILDANAMQTALEGLAVASERQRRAIAPLNSVEDMITALETEQRTRKQQKRKVIYKKDELLGPPDLVGIGIGLLANILK